MLNVENPHIKITYLTFAYSELKVWPLLRLPGILEGHSFSFVQHISHTPVSGVTFEQDLKDAETAQTLIDIMQMRTQMQFNLEHFIIIVIYIFTILQIP